jgi:hypothetical protein
MKFSGKYTRNIHFVLPNSSCFENRRFDAGWVRAESPDYMLRSFLPERKPMMLKIAF